MNLDLTNAVWRKSRRSGHDGGECVEIAALTSRIAVRDSKQPDRGTLTFGRTSWSAFVTALKEQPRVR
jgi:hypothetical protein